MAISLGLLYQVSGSNARATADLMGQEQAMTLAESVLAANALIPPEGVNAQGEAQGYAWQVRTAPFPTEANNNPQAPKLHEIEVRVHWSDGSREREFALKSLRPERIKVPAAELNR